MTWRVKGNKSRVLIHKAELCRLERFIVSGSLKAPASPEICHTWGRCPYHELELPPSPHLRKTQALSSSVHFPKHCYLAHLARNCCEIVRWTPCPCYRDGLWNQMVKVFVVAGDTAGIPYQARISSQPARRTMCPESARTPDQGDEIGDTGKIPRVGTGRRSSHAEKVA